MSAIRILSLIPGFIMSMNKKKQHIQQGSDRGFTILIAAIISSIVITIGVSVVGFVKHQLVLTGISEQSELAMSAADAGIECLSYWEGKGRFDLSTTTSSISCLGQTYSATGGGSFSDSRSWTTDAGTAVCTKMTLTKTASGDTVSTTLVSSGYNVGCGAISSGTEVVERQIKLTK